MWRRGSDSGSATIELVLMLPVAAAMMTMITFTGRVAMARQVADSAAYDAARSASLARTEATARAQANTAANASFAGQGFTCQPLTVTPNLTGFAVPPGQTATVTVTVSCRVDLRDILDLPGLPISDFITLNSSFVSPLDTYRSRT
ncbi:Flp pilus assembly protein TadG [Allocatelliglobosispora scoriae]|uniref:Flp pilus assembly protein TadG n=1 Tax=Allocatelliglobosispora scoriae TaxID=643052 RepID=A0A841BKJ5_9ACTN|nr:TadE family protein [Allocatelliglobosispora scoriae]MBB5869617.1 Flp pilus assembly protein TadG [Allocatelliglobosispora scoriae]